MNRREFLAGTLAASTGVAIAPSRAGAIETTQAGGRRFQLNYAPHFGMFRHHAGDDPVDQVKFMADQGFAALEDNGIKQKPARMQEQIRREMDRHGMQMGVFVATADFGNPTFSSGRREFRDKVLADVRDSIEVANRMNARWCTVVPGKLDPHRPMKQQTANAVELLKRCADLCEPAGLVMVLEPLNHWGRRPELFLHGMGQAHLVCRKVASAACKILFDVYHQQRHAADLVASIDRAWPEIGYFQIGDNPGRKEPGTGDIGYRDLLPHIHAKGYAGIVGMEHGNSKPALHGEQAVIDAYAAHDRF